MAQRFSNPMPQFWSSTAPYSGGILRFYATGSSTPLAYFTDAALSTGSATTHTLNSAGRPTTNIFLQSVDYKVTLEDSSGNIIWTADPVRASDFASFPLWIVGSGNPNGSVAGTAGSSGIMPTKYWDYTNSIEYTCTTTGIAAAAVWTALNSSAATPSVPAPQGRLTLTSATPVLAADVIAATAVYYTPFTGILVPIYNGTSMVATEFAELTLTLVASHAADSLYDVFVFSNSGTLTLATGPAWTTQTPGSSARGTGAGTTQLSRVKGVYTNAVSMTARNGSTTYTIAANRGTYVGTIYIDHTAGNVSCHVAFGQSRKWGVWNAYNREPITLLCGDTTASWAYNTATVRASNNVPSSYSAVIANVGGTASNGLTTLCGLPEEEITVSLVEKLTVSSSSANTTTQTGTIGIGVNSITAQSGGTAQLGSANNPASVVSNVASVTASYLGAPALGLQQLFATETATIAGASAAATFFGTSALMVMMAKWRG